MLIFIVKVTLAQFSPCLGDIGKNLDFHLRTIEKARREKARLVVFPELSLSGYTLMDLVPEAALDPAATRRSKSSPRPAGRSTSPWDSSKKAEQASSTIRRLPLGRPDRSHPAQTFLPTGGMFEEAKFFAAGRSFRTFTTPFGKTGLLICRDFLSAGSSYALFSGGADIIIVISVRRERLRRGRRLRLQPNVGAHGRGGVLFLDGLRRLLQPGRFRGRQGLRRRLVCLRPLGPPPGQGPGDGGGAGARRLRLEDIRAARKKWTFLRDNRPEVVLRSLKGIVDALTINAAFVEKVLCAFIREELHKFGFRRGILGLSGGLDSSVCAALAARALGGKNVLGMIMPYKETFGRDVKDALALAKRLGMRTRLVDISPMVDAYFARYPTDNRVRVGNKMARERMSILYDQSVEEKALILGTSNKTELLIGYGTIHGDMACAINPMGDLYKTQVRALGRYLRLPAGILKKRPTAGLWPARRTKAKSG